MANISGHVKFCIAMTMAFKNSEASSAKPTHNTLVPRLKEMDCLRCGTPLLAVLPFSLYCCYVVVYKTLARATNHKVTNMSNITS